MCTGACSKFIAIPLYVLALVSTICNIMLFFPDFDTEYASDDTKNTPRITDEVKYMGGLIGGGIMVIIPAIHIHLTSSKNCCANRCGVSGEIHNYPNKVPQTLLFGEVDEILGSGLDSLKCKSIQISSDLSRTGNAPRLLKKMFLSIGFAALGVLGGIYSLIVASLGLTKGPVCQWSNELNPELTWGRPFLNTSYLGEKEIWDWCTVPENVVEFNLGLFSILMVAAALEVILCAFQMINGLFGCICGTCSDGE